MVICFLINNSKSSNKYIFSPGCSENPALFRADCNENGNTNYLNAEKFGSKK